MSRSRSAWSLLVGLLALAQVGIAMPAARPAPTYDLPDASTGEADIGPARWLRSARAVQAATRTHLRAADQPACADASFVSYRRSDLLPDVAEDRKSVV